MKELTHPDLKIASPDTDENIVTAAATLHLSVDSVDGLSIFRRDVREWCATGPACGTVVDDLALALTEILTNAFRHGGTDDVLITLVARSTSIVAMTSHIEDPDRPRNLSIVDGPDFGGRGLHIVEQLAAHVRVAVEGDHRATLMIFRREHPAVVGRVLSLAERRARKLAPNFDLEKTG